MNLGEVLRQWRWAQRLSAIEVARLFGTSPGTIRRVETGGNCDGPTLARIIAWLLAEPVRPAPTAQLELPNGSIAAEVKP